MFLCKYHSVHAVSVFKCKYGFFNVTRSNYVNCKEQDVWFIVCILFFDHVLFVS